MSNEPRKQRIRVQFCQPSLNVKQQRSSMKKHRIRVKPDLQKRTEKSLVTIADMEAYGLLLRSGEISLTTENTIAFTAAGDKIIALAEKIKAQRLTVAMQAKE